MKNVPVPGLGQRPHRGGPDHRRHRTHPQDRWAEPDTRGKAAYGQGSECGYSTAHVLGDTLPCGADPGGKQLGQVCAHSPGLPGSEETQKEADRISKLRPGDR